MRHRYILISRAYRGATTVAATAAKAAAAPPAWQGTLQQGTASSAPHPPGAQHGRPSHGARRAATARPLRWRRGPARSRPRKGDRGPRAAPRVPAARRGAGAGRPTATSPRGPRTGRPRLARQQLSGTSWRKERLCAWSWGTSARRWLGALVQLTSCAPPARAEFPRRARGDPGWRTSEALTGGSAQPPRPRMSLPGGRPYPWGRGGPRSASAGAKAGVSLNHPRWITLDESPSMSHSERPIPKRAPRRARENSTRVSATPSPSSFRDA